MGWLLTKKKKSSKKPRARGPARKAWSPERTHRLMRLAALAQVLGGLGAAWGWGQGALRRAVVEHDDPLVPRVELLDVPAWVPPRVAQQIRDEVALAVSADPFDRDSLLGAARTISASPWIKEVHRLWRRPGHVVEVSCEYRQGAALVKTSTGCHLIDLDGVRLPFTYTPREAGDTGLPILTGVAAAPPDVGRPWTGDDLSAGMSLAGCIAGQGWRTKVAAIDVTNHAGRRDPRRPHLKLLTALDADADPFNNPGLEWGRTPGEERFYEPNVSWKLRRASLEFTKHFQLDDRILNLTSEPGLTLPLAVEEPESPETLANADTPTPR